jgi:dCMP deaminase
MRPSNWIDYYIGLAHVISQKSHDIQTQHGCVITDNKHRVLGLGYNGFPRSIDDSALPNTRPDKYPWMIHAERNALSNCIIRPDNAIAYVTGQCCNDCIMALWQEGISTVYMHDRHGSHLLDAGAMDRFNKFIELTSMQIHYVKPNLNWLMGVYDRIN